MACKNKWWPHNWFCLRGLYWLFVALFYITFVYMLWIVYALSASPMISGDLYWSNLFAVAVNCISLMLGFITVAKILQVLRKIKKAVAPCCCEGHKESPTITTVVEHESK